MKPFFAAVAFILVVVSPLTAAEKPSKKSSPQPSPQIATIARQVRQIEQQAKQYRKAELDVEEYESGAATAYLLGRELKKIVLRVYGESGYSVTEHYFHDGKLIFVLETLNRYKTHYPLDEHGNEDPNWKPIVSMRIKDRYYFKDGKLVRTVFDKNSLEDCRMSQKELLDEVKQLREELAKRVSKRT